MKFITRAANILLSRTVGPSITRTQDPQPRALLFQLKDGLTGSMVVIDEEMALYLIKEIQQEIRIYSEYNSLDTSLAIK
jgi:hypothetical protein